MKRDSNPESGRTAVRIVGDFIKEKREAQKLSQKNLGKLLNPPVTTQFISNIERGVTPLPLVHVLALAKALKVTEAEMKHLLEKEYAAKLGGRLPGGSSDGDSSGGSLSVSPADYPFMKKLYEAYQAGDQRSKEAFYVVCRNLFKISLQ